MKVKGIEFRVKCNGAPLPEYEVKGEDGGNASSYIPSEAGKNFVIAVHNTSAHALSCHVHCDGVLLNNCLIQPDELMNIDSVLIDRSNVKPLLFSVLQLTDDERALAPGHRTLDKLGLIEVSVFRCETRHSTQVLTNLHVGAYDVNHEPVHERFKAVGSHSIVLGESKKIAPAVGHYIRYIDPITTPFARSAWRYRPKGLLQAQGIVPRDPPTEQSGQHRRRGGLKREREDDELDSLIAEVTALRERIRGVALRRRTARESSPIRLAKGCIGEVIDLTME